MWTLQSEVLEFESNFYYLLASSDQLLKCLVPQTADSQMDNNNTGILKTHKSR